MCSMCLTTFSGFHNISVYLFEMVLDMYDAGNGAGEKFLCRLMAHLRRRGLLLKKKKPKVKG